MVVRYSAFRWWLYIRTYVCIELYLPLSQASPTAVSHTPLRVSRSSSSVSVASSWGSVGSAPVADGGRRSTRGGGRREGEGEGERERERAEGGRGRERGRRRGREREGQMEGEGYCNWFVVDLEQYSTFTLEGLAQLQCQDYTVCESDNYRYCRNTLIYNNLSPKNTPIYQSTYMYMYYLYSEYSWYSPNGLFIREDLCNDTQWSVTVRKLLQ